MKSIKMNNLSLRTKGEAISSMTDQLNTLKTLSTLMV